MAQYIGNDRSPFFSDNVEDSSSRSGPRSHVVTIYKPLNGDDLFRLWCLAVQKLNKTEIVKSQDLYQSINGQRFSFGRQTIVLRNTLHHVIEFYKTILEMTHTPRPRAQEYKHRYQS